MNRLWDYEDYVNHLSHQNKIVRRWAFAAIENHYPNRYADEVCNLIGDEVEHLACAAPRYLAMHEAVQHAPAILESFKTDHGNVPSNCAIALGNMYYEPALDVISLTLLEDLSKRSSIWKRIKDSKQSGRNLISLILSGYFGIKERGAYLTALSPNAGVEDLIWALKNSGPSLPKPIQQKIKQMEPISELKNTLTEDLKTWGDIWTVKMIGRIGNEEFVPNLIRVLRNSDSLDYIYSDAIRAMNALDDSADEIILAAIKNKELENWETFPILEYLPYAEAYDLALQRWEDEKNEMDSHELFAGCLRGIGDPRGIETLQYVYANENDATYIEEDLECLSIIHNVEIPEMPDILVKRQEQEERQKARAKELNELAAKYKQNKEQGRLENGGKVVPFQRDSPKIGRNESCPCGSGKKYKKCCLNKISPV